ncbi:MAG TPA: RNA polymerase factor sigma-32 [Polyangia bacterium]|nr:RNA polymerase factor sigma-32 [Polyangia bacterium]
MTTTRALARVSELDRYMAGLERYPLLSAEDEQALARRWRDLGDVQAAHALVTANLRFVVKIAFEYKGYAARMLDLIQEGSVGLMQAVKRFDPDRGYRLISYAVSWIRSYIHAFLMGTARMIKVGTSRAHRKLFFKLRSLQGRLEASGVTRREDVFDAVAREVGVSVGDVEEMDRHLRGRDASLDAPVTESGSALAEILPSDRANQEESLAELEVEADRRARLETALLTLDPRERTIVERRYLSEEPPRLEDLGAELGVTKQRVSQLERRAFGKLRTALAPAV